MKIKSMSDFGMSYERPLLRKLFNQIKKRNYYADETEDFRAHLMKGDLTYIIEDFFLRNNNIQYTYTENHEMPLLDEDKMQEERDSLKYYDLSQSVYGNLQPEIEIFIDVNMSKELYLDTDYDDSKKTNIFLHSAEIVRKEIEVIKDKQPDLYSEIETYLDDFEIEISSIDFHQNKKSGLLSYITVLTDSNTNFILESKYREKFYPIIVDILLDYAHIMDILNSHDADLKNKKKRYCKFREVLVSGDDPIHPLFYYLLKFSKEERVDNVKRYLLNFYLEEFDQDGNINTLFRKLFLKKLKERNDYTPADMKNYEPSSHLLFGILNNFKYFL